MLVVRHNHSFASPFCSGVPEWQPTYLRTELLNRMVCEHFLLKIQILIVKCYD